MADVQTTYKNTEEKMDGALKHLDDALAIIRAGKANVRILDPVRVDYYGQMTQLSGVASITTPDARTISIQPWEKKMLPAIEKAILASEVGITPENNGEIIRLSIPPLTEDRRKQLVKQVKAETENAKVAVRNARRDAIEGLKKEVKNNGLAEDAEKDAEEKIQKMHDKYIKMVDDAFAAKEKEIMTV
ncbi:MAG: ribosome recycling factor [Paludibacteraceae bacterium]|nr:ribosome recycling factor [Candidatus Physcocola equi]MCQ2234707.1 ribosome recycling factor [Paludibacteraceae bacterium]